MSVGGISGCRGGYMPMQRLSFDDADTDDDDSLSLDEFSAVGKNLPAGKNVLSDDQIKSLFDSIDTDQNGTISKAEAKSAYDKITDAMQNNLIKLQERFDRPPPPSPDQIMANADANQDGVLSLSEFKADAVKHGPAGASDEKLQKMFDDMDADGDGNVTSDELKNFFEKGPQKAQSQDAQSIDMTTLFAQAASAYTSQNSSTDIISELLSVLKGVQA